MRKIILLLLTLLCSNFLFAQHNFGVSAGTNWSIMDVKNSSFDDNHIIAVQKINFGLSYLKSINNSLELQTDLRYMQKGFYQKLGEVSPDTSISMMVELNYLELPIRLNSKIELGKLNLIVGVGGYLGYGFSGRISCSKSYPSDDSYFTENIWAKRFIDYDSSDPDKPKNFVVESGYIGLHRLDYGLISSIGAEYKNFRLMFDYTYGLRLLTIENGQGDMFNHKVYNISLSYILDFSGKDKKKAEKS